MSRMTRLSVPMPVGVPGLPVGVVAPVVNVPGVVVVRPVVPNVVPYIQPSITIPVMIPVPAVQMPIDVPVNPVYI